MPVDRATFPEMGKPKSAGSWMEIRYRNTPTITAETKPFVE
jgi:hypothetical protein